MDNDEPIYVTKPFLPPLEELLPYLESIWENRILTNSGPFHQELEQALCDFLGVKYISLFANGTLALVTALQALRITGEVITTPYSFVATSHALHWNDIKPVFADIDSKTLNLDPEKIEAAITSHTTAILPVHVYGEPCDVDSIQKIADNYNLKVIYDAAHAFGVKNQRGSILKHGDLSILSFHATKVFNTFEGGAIISPTSKMKQHIDHLKNFGFVDETKVVAPGINSKMSELNSAIGLLQLKYIEQVINKRKKVDEHYRHLLGDLDAIDCIEHSSETIANYAYFPIIVHPEYPMTRDELFECLREHQIFARRYFYPLISDFSMYRGLQSAKGDNLTVARQTADKVICLPIYPDIEKEVVEKICRIIKEAYES